MRIQMLPAVLWKAAAIAVFTLAAPLTANTAAGDPLGPDFRVNAGPGDVVNPAIARDSVGNIVVAWRRLGAIAPGIYARRYSAGGSPLGSEFAVPLADGTPSVAMDASGNFVVTSSSYDVAGKRSNIQFQRYAANGIAQGAATEVASVRDLAPYSALHLSASLLAKVAMAADGDFVIAWSWTQMASAGGPYTLLLLSADIAAVHARRYRADGTAKGAAFLVHADLPDVWPLSYAMGDVTPTLAMDANGGFVAAWTNTGLYSNTVEYKRYDANGKAQGLMQRANPSNIKVPRAATVAGDPAGDFTMVWADTDGGPGAPNYVRAQRYSNTGAAKAGPLVANSPTTDTLQSPAVGMQPGGDFVVAWTRYQPGVSTIDAQRFAADGSAQGGNFQVNSAASGIQNYPAIAVDGYGDFAIAWAQSEQGGNAFDGIYLRLYHGN